MPMRPRMRCSRACAKSGPQAWPNSVMIGFADAQLGREGRLTQALRRHYGHQLAAQPHYRQWMTDLGRQAELAMAL